MKLYAYQEEGVEFLASRKRAYLADEMGLGKTAQACAAARRAVAESARILVVAPASAIDNWRKEWETWAGGWGSVTFASWASRQDHEGPWDLLILDEAHYAKTPTAARTKKFLGLAQEAEVAWCLSGTPTPNKHLGELYTVFAALRPDVCASLGLYNFDRWFDHFCRWSLVGKYPMQRKRVYGIKNTSDLTPHLKSFILKRSLKDVEIELPELLVSTHRLPRDKNFLSAEQAAAYERMAGLEGGDSVSALRRHLGIYKAPRIAKVIAEELAGRQYEKVVIMAYHRDVLEIFRDKLWTFGVTGFDGRTPVGKRQDIIDEFGRDPGTRVFVVQQVAGGTAIDGLQVSTEIVLAEPDFTPDSMKQQIKRIHRIGTKKVCRARVFAVTDTLDEGILGTLMMRLRHEKEIGI